MRLIIRERESMMADLTISGKLVLIGSHPTCDVYLPDGRLAPRQAIIEPEGQFGWTIRPLDATVITTVNKALLRSRHRLKNGDEIGLADYVIRVYLEDVSPAVSAAMEAETVEPSAAEARPARRWALPADAVVLRSSDMVSLEPAGVNLLGQLTSVLYQSDDVADMLERLNEWLLSAVKADCAWACLAADPEHEPHFCSGIEASGGPCKPPEKTALLVHRVVQRQESILFPTDRTRYASAMAAPLAAGPTALGLIYVHRQIGKPAFSKSELALVRAVASHAGVRLDELLRGQQKALKQRGQEQSLWAHQIQERLTPAVLPHWENLEIAAYRLAGTACCADIYDVVKMPSGAAALILGHAMAAGVESALLMAELRAAFRVALLHADATHFILKELNWLVHDPQAQSALRCFVGLFDPKTGQIRYSVAGRPGAYLLTAKGEAIDLIRREAPEIGATRDAEFPPHGGQIAPGDSLVLFTCGLVTAANPAGEAFGLEQVLGSLRDVADKSAHLMLQALVDDLTSHLAGQDPSDDITVLILRRIL